MFKLSWSTTALAVFCWMSAFAWAEPFGFYASPDIHAGQKLVFELSFPAPPSTSDGPADLFLVDAGSVSSDVIGVTTNLYSGNQLLGSYFAAQPVAYGVFVTPLSLYSSGSPYGVSPPIVDLSSIFDGSAEAIVEIIPSFSDVQSNPNIASFISFSFAPFSIEAGRSTGVATFDDASPGLDLISVNVVPEPGSFELVLAAIAAIGLRRFGIGRTDGLG
jgi:hypothetical protein